MHTFSWLLARRYLRSTTQSRHISAMVFICFAGILIGSFALTLVAAVMNGFEHATHEKLQGIQPQIIVRAFGLPMDFAALSSTLSKEFPTVAGVAPSDTRHALIANEEFSEMPLVVAVRGIDPQHEPTVTALHKKLAGDTALADALKNDGILIGHRLADELDTAPGEQLTLLLTPDEPTSKTITLSKHHVRVGGVFDTGIEEYDMNIVFCSLEQLAKLFPASDVTQIGIRLAPDADEGAVIAELQTRLGELSVYSWKDLYPAIIAVLKLEKYTMFLILALITLVACTNIISLMFMQIMQKRGDIAILCAMGMGMEQLRNVFLLMGVGIALTAATLGVCCATVTSYVLEKYQLISLPDVYYVSHLPAHMTWQIAAAVLLVTLALSIAATWFPIQRIRSLNIANILRFEA